MCYLNYTCKSLKLKSKVILGHTVAMVTYCITKMITTDDWALDNMIVASSDKESLVITTHQNLSAGNFLQVSL